MKKIISAFISTVLGVTALSSVTAVAADKDSMVLLGDSIAAGYTRKGDVEHNYGEICGDYLGCDVFNYAKVGDTTDDMLEKLAGFSAEQNKNLSDAEYVVISVGGNDIMGYIAKYMLDYAERKDFFNEGYSAKDVPEHPNVADMTRMIDVNAVKERMQGSYTEAMSFSTEIGNLSSDICGSYDKKAKTYSGGYIGDHVITNVQKAVDSIKKTNPNAKVYVQTIFQPVQLEPSYVSTKYGKGSNASLMLSVVRLELENIMKSYSDQLADVSGIEVVDVWDQFTSYNGEIGSGKTAYDMLSTNNPGNTHYFVDIQAEKLSDIDVHPNQSGHVAIAAAILEKIGKLHDDTGLLSSTFESLSDKSSYPEHALATYKKVAGEQQPSAKSGDVNSDGFVDAVDASSVLAEYAKRSTGEGSFTDAQAKLADVDVNGIVDSVDASKILAYYAYLSSSTGSVKPIEEFIKTL
ncbi:GDSL-type esterase/lipase family protein [Ruminococcus sp.]|uniref:GDSL-type esterase/lipase family protein n=1 Tax=Ruminococcus sp. TaxID=41978 RepID=UPI0025D5CB93|nr:GDSL-type esterase/lipase family protein [Ruminococcus sp.]